MSTYLDAMQPSLVLRLLLGDCRADPKDLEWSALPVLAERQRVPLRLAECLESRNAMVSPRFTEATAQAHARAERVLVLLARVADACDQHGIPYVALKIARDFPDVGGDMDLLVSGAASGLERVLRDLLPVVPRRRSLHHHLAGTEVYPVPEYGTVVDVHHGRLGQLGEHARYAALLLSRRRRADFGAISCFIPSLEDQLVQQALSYGAGRPAVRLADAYWTISTVRGGRLDWELLLDTARATGLLPALSCHLSCVEQLQQRLLGRPLLEPEVRRRLVQHRWGRMEFRRGSFRLTAPRARAGLFFRQLQAELKSGDWAAVGRLCLLPVVAAYVGWHRLARPFGPGDVT